MYRLSRLTLLFLLRVAIACIAMAGVIHYFDLHNAFYLLSLSEQILHVSKTIGAAVGVFVAVLLVLGTRPSHFKASGG